VPTAQGRLSPAQLKRLPPPIHHAYLHAFTDALSTVFLVAAAIAAVGFLLSWLLVDRPLRETVAASGPAEHFAAPRSPDSLDEIYRALSTLARRDARRRMIELIAERAGVELPAAACWTLARLSEHPPGGMQAVCERYHVDYGRIAEALKLLEDEGLVQANGEVTLTPAGEEVLGRLIRARRERLAEQLDGWSPEQEAELAALLNRLAEDTVGDGFRT
jgi:DNA-binding MarR family transcriptional regulator